MAKGTVVRWNDVEGWGVISSDEVPGEVWTIFSHIESEGATSLSVGEPVEFDWHEMSRPGGQDGYSFRTTRLRPLGGS